VCGQVRQRCRPPSVSRRIKMEAMGFLGRREGGLVRVNEEQVCQLRASSMGSLRPSASDTSHTDDENRALLHGDRLVAD
ncbi:uncharacterized protein METZ01_LOCUS59042, partial [marine metagenome]